MPFVSVFLMTAMGAIASIFFKKASGSNNILGVLKNPNLYIGGFLYCTAALLNIYVLKFLDYSVVLPLTSITYIWTMVLSFFMLNEKISKKKILGVLCIILGAILVAMK